ncbi:cell wall protein IFF6-like isoform X4 [Haliotis rufescens]|uniref:cell wall protein IFF6-like isoform X4 n=1 Tax=Haliotis rufescens TaxID=6454 RepID=UPI00201EACDF|nr:cell wall protein IFF6-like isoform X4 [Haliotis rufescens]
MGLTAMYVERAFVVCVHFLLAAHGDTRTGNRCIEGLPGSFTVQLNCSAGEWIHVKNEAYGDGDTTTCRLKYDLSCSRVHNSSQNGLIVNCNGKQLCRETIQPTPRTNCNFTDAAAEVQYNCIQGSMDLCSTETTVHGSVYLHSPGFPDSVGVNSSCIVRITGQNIRVTLVEERMKTGLLNISGDGKQLWTSVNVNQYNRLLQATADEVVVVVYDNHGQNGSNVWIRVEASGQMNITSTRQISDVSATSVTPSTQQPSRSPGTTSQSTSATPTTATTTSTPSITMNQSTTEAVTANLTTKETTTSPTTPDTDINTSVAAMVGVLALCCVSLIVYCKVIRPYRTNLRSNSQTSASENIPRKVLQTPSQYRIQNNNVTEDNSYSNLVMYDRSNNYERLHQRNDSGEDHGYGDTITEGPLYINTVGGEDHKGDAGTEGGPSYINSGGVEESYSETGIGGSLYANSNGGEDSYSDIGRGGPSYANSCGGEDSYSDTGIGEPSYANSGGTEDSYSDTGIGESSYANSGGVEDS